MTPQTLELAERLRWAQAHPVLGLAATMAGAVVTKTPAVGRRLVAHVNAARPDMGEEIKRRLQPAKRTCPHCARAINKDLERCPHCGLFVPNVSRTAKAEIDALLQPADPGVARQRIAPGMIVSHTPSGLVARVLTIDYDQRAILRDPTGRMTTVPVSELEALGSAGAQPVPGDTQGRYEGRPALSGDITAGQPYQLTGTGKADRAKALTKAPRCGACGRQLSQEDLDDGECPGCGLDLSDPDNVEQDGQRAAGTGLGGWAPTPADGAKARAYFSSPPGMLKLARGILRNTRQPGALFGRSSSIPAGMRKGLSFARGERVKNRRTGQRGVVLQCGGGTAAVEYKTARGTAMTMEKVAELERV
jgi:hypothetical protein